MIRPLNLTTDLMARIDAQADEAGVNECMALLASPPSADAINDMEMLEATASPSSALAAPLAVKHAVDALRSRGLVPRGIWHSHGHGPVFHSGTDHATIDRLLPAMAEWCVERDPPTVATPAIDGPDSAVLPLPDGRLIRLALRPTPVPDSEMLEPQRWSRVDVDLLDASEAASVVITAAHLRLGAGHVALRLGIPDAVTVETTTVDPEQTRIARLYSLVVNAHQERYAQCLVVVERAGDSITHLGDCPIHVDGVELPPTTTRPREAARASWRPFERLAQLAGIVG
jgi:proteasome lid subunit RPN8/RPN11